VAKKCWLTWLPTGEGAPDAQPLVMGLSRVGLDASGAPWADDLEKVAWSELGTILTDADSPVDLWVIAGRAADFAAERVRFGLSMTAAMTLGMRTAPLRVLVGCLDADAKSLELPTLLGHAARLAGPASGWPAKVVAAAHRPAPPPPIDFHISVIAHSLIGTWLEVGPTAGATWHGALVGVSETGEITHHAVGRRGELPERTVVEYACQGIQAELGGDTFGAWSVQNRIGDDQSYYVKVSGHPTKAIVGGDAAAETPEVTVLTLA